MLLGAAEYNRNIYREWEKKFVFSISTKNFPTGFSHSISSFFILFNAQGMYASTSIQSAAISLDSSMCTVNICLVQKCVLWYFTSTTDGRNSTHGVRNGHFSTPLAQSPSSTSFHYFQAFSHFILRFACHHHFRCKQSEIFFILHKQSNASAISQNGWKLKKFANVHKNP